MYFDDKTIIYFNKQFVKAAEAKTGLYDQSLHYGYSAFEGIRSYATENGTRIFKAEEHYKRLQFSCNAVGIPFDYTVEQLIDISYSVLTQNNLENAYLRPLVFCPPSMTLQKAKSSFLMIAAWNWEAYLGEQLLRVMTSSYQRPNPKGFKIHAKIGGHYVNSILACQEAKDSGFDEALLLDIYGNVAEGPGANLFMEKDGQLITPPTECILPGITRATVIEIANEFGIAVEEKTFTIDELRQADSAFYCGTAAEVIGWKSIDDVAFPKQWSASLGSVIQKAYKARVLEQEYKMAYAF
jgi:branched-chain amino acid aminotransferase